MKFISISIVGMYCFMLHFPKAWYLWYLHIEKCTYQLDVRPLDQKNTRTKFRDPKILSPVALNYLKIVLFRIFPYKFKPYQSYHPYVSTIFLSFISGSYHQPPWSRTAPWTRREFPGARADRPSTSESLTVAHGSSRQAIELRH